MVSDDEGVMATKGEAERISAIERILKHPGQIVFGASIAIVLVWGLYFWNFAAPLSDSREVWGQFGDFVGGTLNSIFGFASFTLLLYSLHMQSKELRETKKELEASRKAQEMQAEHFEREAKKADHSQAIRHLSENYLIEFQRQRLTIQGTDNHRVSYNIDREYSHILDFICSNSTYDYLLNNKFENFKYKTLMLDMHMSGLRDNYPISPLLYDINSSIAPMIRKMVDIRLLRCDELKFKWAVLEDGWNSTPPAPPT